MKQGISARIRIKYQGGREILYTTDYETLLSFCLQKDEEFGTLTVIQNGTELRIENNIFKVVDIYTYFYDKLNDNSEQTGINLYSYGNQFPFNFEITYYVEKK